MIPDEKKEKEEKSPSEPSHTVCFAIEYVDVQAVSMTPLLQPIGGPGTEAYLWGGVDGRQEVRVAGGQLFSSSKNLTSVWTQT